MKKWIFLSELGGLWKKIRKSSPTAQAGYLAMVAMAAVALLYLVFSLAFLNKVYPNVVVGGVSFSGLSYEQTTRKLEKLVATEATSVTLKYQDKTQKLDQAEVDWSYDEQKTAKAIFEVGRNEESRLKSFYQQLISVFIRQPISPVVNYDEQALETAVSTFAALVDSPAVNADARFVRGELMTTTEKAGEVIDQGLVGRDIVKYWGEFRSGEVEVRTFADEPTIVLGDIATLENQVAKLKTKNLRLNWPKGVKQLSSSEIRQLIDFVGGANLANSNKQLLTAKFTAESARDYLRELAEEINQPAVEPRLAITGEKLVVTAPSKSGLVVDVVISGNSVEKALNSATDNPLVELTMAEQKPAINEENLDALGITEQIGYGITSFSGSPSNRIHNIKTGVGFLQSALIAPGKEFSTVSTLGEVDDTTGYLPELVIKENRTVPEYGGGLCQVSTTLFRAVLDAGLKVTERRNHSYRVSYYEPPVGLDATIYLPKPDFMFVNDTKHHILVQGRVVGNNVIFELWGTGDGRTSSVTEPKFLSVTKPGKPIRVETDTLPKGEEKQIEKEHDGAVTIAYYTVKRDGKVINQQTFKSVYKAWPARFLVGTNENLPKTTP